MPRTKRTSKVDNTPKPRTAGGTRAATDPQPSEFRFEAWPSEFRAVTQKFGVNSQDYAKFGLPGHEGIDIRAPSGSKIFCVAPGLVKLVHPSESGHNYGIHVRVLHAEGYETVYAHLQSIAVAEGQPVMAGQLLGLADSTGNTKGAHLHLTLKHDGETRDGYPNNIIDPTPFLAPLLSGERAAPGLVQLQVAEKLGLNCNAPTDPDGKITPRVADAGLIADTGVGWVRLNFILRPFSSPDDPSWINTYRHIVRGLRDRGLEIYGLIGAEAAASDPGNQFRDQPPADPIENNWIREYAQNFRLIVQQFRDDVAIFESFNEPNDWHRVPGDKPWEQAWVHPHWFAVMLQQVYEAVRDLNVKLVSGPLLSTEDGNDAAAYLPKVYDAGKDRYHWGEAGAPFPFDGVGFHPYVLRDPPNPETTIPARYQEYMQPLRDLITRREGYQKPLYLSEIGWQNPEDRQVACMQAGIKCALADPTVALCFWYGMQDDHQEFYGLYRREGLSTDHRKPVYGHFADLVHENRLVPAAAIRPTPVINSARYDRELDAIPDGTLMAPGRAFTKIWRLVNTGTTTWGDGYRFLRVEGQGLGAPASIEAPHCPPGQAANLAVTFVAPSSPQDYTSAWRLVDPQGNPFGDKVWTRIRVQIPITPAEPRGLPFAPALPELAELAPEQPALAAALGIIYTTYWLRALAASSAADPQQALLAAANDALVQIKEYLPL